MAFRCIHCGSNNKPKTFIDSSEYRNKQMLILMILFSAVTCCLGSPVLLLYPFMAHRTHVCRDCDIRFD
jgi:hypothetical protein